MTNASLRFAVFVLTLFVAASVCATADHLQGVVMTVLITSASTVDERTERILTESVLIALDRAGIEAVIADMELSDEEPSRRDITRLAREGASDFVLICTYNLTPGSTSTLAISLALYLADPAIPVATFRGKAEINLTLDRSVAAFLDTLLEEAFSYLTETESDLLGNDSGAVAGPAGTAPTNGAAATTPDALIDSETGARDPGAQPAVAQDTLEFAVGYSPAFAVGDASEYYQFAHGAGGYLHLVLGRRNTFGIGIAGSATFATATGVAADGELLIVPFAASVAFRSDPAPLGAYLSLGGGGALIRVANPAFGTLMKLAPYATASVGMKLALLNWVGINAGVAFGAIFEGSVLLTSFAPSISLYLGF